ncbi:MAG: 2-hydroxyacid dehydrogenase [Bacteroidota bacterium]
MKTTIFSISPYEKPLLEQGDQQGLELIYKKERLGEDTTDLAKGSEAVSIFASDKAPAEVLEKLKDLGVKYIATRSMGIDHIDTDKAHELGIKVAHVPHYSPHSVAEHSIALMLALNRNLIQSHHKVRDYNFLLDGLVGFDMNNKTVGMVGAGEIGSVSARILNGFGCNLLVYDVEKNDELIEKYNARYVDMDELCSGSDIITIHAPLTKETEHLVDKKKIDRMKDGVMIINTARGAICKTEDIIEGLKEGKIGSLGMDVYEHEKGLYFEDHSNDVMRDDLFVRLMGFKNVLITAHQAFLTYEALKENMETTLANLRNWARGEDAEHQVDTGGS